jgi:hypothetical protein
LLYHVKLSDAEKGYLTMLIGNPVNSVRGDGFSVELWVGELVLSAVPDEMHTPDDGHPEAEVTRPVFAVAESPQLIDEPAIMARDLGDVVSIRVLSTFVSFSPVTVRPPLDLGGGVVLPESPGYEELHHSSVNDAAEAAVADNAALVSLDIGVELETDRDHRILVFTLGYSVRAAVDETAESLGIEGDSFSSAALSLPA